MDIEGLSRLIKMRTISGLIENGTINKSNIHYFKDDIKELLGIEI